MAYDVQQQVDAYETMGLGALQNMQRKNPKLLVGIALENLQKDMQEQQRAKQMASGAVGPTVIDKKLMGLAGAGVGLGQQQAMATAAPGLQMRGRQMQAAQMRKAMAPQPQPMRMAGGGIIGFSQGGTNQSQSPRPTPDGQPTAAAQDATMDNINNYIKLYRAYEASKAAAKTPEEKQRVEQNFKNTIENFDPDTKAKAHQKMSGMQGGGIVGYAPGGRVTADDIDMEDLLTALMIAESGGNPRAVSSAGAEGAYQIMPSTAENPGFGVSPMEGSRFDPEASRKFARDYLQAMIDRYDGDIEAALIAYNAGAGNADKFVAGGRDYDVLPQTMQTQPYVSKIMSQLEREGRRRDIQLGGGRTISTTAPESYTERMRRQRADRLRGIETARMPPRPPEETELYKPNIPDALLVAKAQDALLEPKRLQEQLVAVGDMDRRYTPEERAAGGVGYLQYLARKEKERKDREAKAAAGYLRTMQNQEDMISEANPATNLSGVDLRQDFSTERSMKSPAQRMEEAFPGAREAAGRYALDKAAGLAALSDYAPEAARSNNPLVNLRSDLGEIGSYLQRVLGFQEGGQIKNFQEGDLVEADGEQVIPLSSITDDPGVIDTAMKMLRDNKEDIITGAGIALTFVPFVGPAFRAVQGANFLAKGLGALRGARGIFGTNRALGPGSRARNILSTPFTRRNPDPRIGVRDPGLGKTVSMKEAMKPRGAVPRGRNRRGQAQADAPARDPLVAPRVFSPAATARTAAGVGGASLLLGGRGESSEAAPRDTSTLPRNRSFDVEAFSEAFPELAEEMRRRPQTDYDQQLAEVRERARQNQSQESRGGGQGILSRLGSALSSDKAQQLYSAFQDLGLAGGAARGQEGTQLINALTTRDFAEREAAARDRALDIDEQQVQLTSQIAQSDLIGDIVNSVAFTDLSEAIAKEKGLDRSDPEVFREALNIMLGSMGRPGLAADGFAETFTTN